MRIIKKLEDLAELRQSGVAEESLLKRLEADFRMMMNALRVDEPEERFSLQEHGYMVILEDTDDLRDLRNVGLNPEENGLLGSWPEWIEEIQLSGQTIYKICVLYDNEYMMTFYARLNNDPEALAWARSFVP